MMNTTKRSAALAVLLLVAVSTGVVAQETQAPAEHVQREAYVMGTRLSVRVAPSANADAAAETAIDAVRRVEGLVSTWRNDTDLAWLNRAPVGQWHTVSRNLLPVLLELDRWVGATNGAFDPAIGALVDAWDLRGDGRVPSETELQAAQAASGWWRLTVDDENSEAVRETEGLWLDAGGFGKGLALRRAARTLRNAGAAGTLNFGGQVVAVGPDAVPVDVAHPAARDRSVATLSLRNASVATSSVSEQPGHILDPRTGRPVEAWGSVTVVSEDPMAADILSTALFVMGPDDALEWAAGQPHGVLVQELTGDEPIMAWNQAMEEWLDESSVRGRVRQVGAAAGPGAVTRDSLEIARLQRQIDAITRELERMRMGGDVVAQADTGVLGFGPAASKIYRVDQGVSIGGYGEVLYEVQSNHLENGQESQGTNRFDALRAIIYAGYKFSDRLLVNTEIEIEHANEAFLEFAYLEYRLSDAIGFRGGLLLSPMGITNELHEPPTFLGTTRPVVEQQLIPTTWRENGFGVFGDVGPFTYRAYVMNGLEGLNFSADGLRGGRQKGSQALAEDVAIVIRADLVNIPGFLLGGSFYQGGSGQNAEVTVPVGNSLQTFRLQANTRIWEGHFAFEGEGMDFRGLLAGATVDDADLLHAAGAEGVADALSGGFFQAGYNVLWFFDTGVHEVFPFVRYEWLDSQAELPTDRQPDREAIRSAVLLGATWKPIPQVAIKADYQIHNNRANTGRNRFVAAISYLF